MLPRTTRSGPVKISKDLDFPQQDVVVLRAERREDRTESALLFVPDNARDYLRERIQRYGNDPGNQKRPDLDRFERIETIQPAAAHSLFVGTVDFDSPDTVWWELWVRGDKGLVQPAAG